VRHTTLYHSAIPGAGFPGDFTASYRLSENYRLLPIGVVGIRSFRVHLFLSSNAWTLDLYNISYCREINYYCWRRKLNEKCCIIFGYYVLFLYRRQHPSLWLFIRIVYPYEITIITKTTRQSWLNTRFFFDLMHITSEGRYLPIIIYIYSVSNKSVRFPIPII